MAEVIQFNDGDVRPVANLEDALDIIAEKLGDDIRHYILEELEWMNEIAEEYEAIIEEYDEMKEAEREFREYLEHCNDEKDDDDGYDPTWG